MKKQVKIKKVEPDKKTSQKFIIALSIVSIMGFLSIVMETIFSFSLDIYLDFVLMLTVGIGLLVDANFHTLKTLRNGLTPDNFSHLIVAVIGFLAVLAGIFSLPQILVEHPLFLSTKGIISIIAILVIIVQTWFSHD